MACEACGMTRAVVVRPRDGSRVCKPCFFDAFETEIHRTIALSDMFRRGWRVGIGVSGGKDSTVLAFVLDVLNRRYNYGVELVLLSVDEGIRGYRDHSLDTVLGNSRDLGLRLETVSFEEVFGITMDGVVERIGRRGNCTYCGVFRRQALEEAARRAGVDCIVTGHNADDVAETVLLNIVRGDVSRLRRCTSPRTRTQVLADGTVLSLPRLKPFRNTYQKEIVLYAFYKRLRYFSTECTYSPGASRQDLRMLVKELARTDPTVIMKIIRSGEMFQLSEEHTPETRPCGLCTHPTSSESGTCNGCTLVRNLGATAHGSNTG